MIKRYLLTPGPTPVPPEVALTMAQPIIHHRTPQFSKLFAEVRGGLQALFQTRRGRAHAGLLRHRRDGSGGRQHCSRPATACSS